MSTKAQKAHLIDEEESYYVSMTDLMVGVIFIFIIILMYFALRFQEAEANRKASVQALEDAHKARVEILVDLKNALELQKIAVEIDEENGILHLPNEVLFDSGRARIKPKGEEAIHALSQALMVVLPCYIPGRNVIEICVGRVNAQIESIFIEGHTDNEPVGRDNPYRDNWHLSTERAISTFSQMLLSKPELDALSNYRAQPLFSVSGYSEFRPRAKNDTEEGMQANRRIDLRILMRTPTSKDLEVFDSQIQQRATDGTSEG